MPGIRIDSGVAEGDEVSVHYDPLLAKVIASAETRDVAIVALVTALRDFPVLGVETNIPFLIGVLEHQRFRDGDVDTAFLDEAGQDLAAATVPTELPAVVVAVRRPLRSRRVGPARSRDRCTGRRCTDARRRTGASGVPAR